MLTETLFILTLEQKRDVLLKTYKLEKDPDYIINEIKSMKINKGNIVKEFNKKYLPFCFLV